VSRDGDRGAVLDVLARFAHGIDGRDWVLYRSVFADEFEGWGGSFQISQRFRWTRGSFAHRRPRPQVWPA